ncbi:MAG: hypothetical protein GY820_47760 [Gammaproteobacteria bacterium]|nr:hypothetical protein [Gammaproteobacteria bacterium]
MINGRTLRNTYAGGHNALFRDKKMSSFGGKFKRQCRTTHILILTTSVESKFASAPKWTLCRLEIANE